MKKIVIELKGSWILAHRGDGRLPVAALDEELGRALTGSVTAIRR